MLECPYQTWWLSYRDSLLRSVVPLGRGVGQVTGCMTASDSMFDSIWGGFSGSSCLMKTQPRSELLIADDCQVGHTTTFYDPSTPWKRRPAVQTVDVCAVSQKAVVTVTCMKQGNLRHHDFVPGAAPGKSR